VIQGNSYSDLPDSWEVVKLGVFVESEKGKKPKSESEFQTPTHSIPYIDIQAFEESVVRSWTDGVGCRICCDSDFLMVWDGSRSGLVGKGMNGALGSTLMRINFPSMVNHYAFYFLQSKYQQINTRAKGSGTPHVDPDLLWNYDFPIPPLNEQHRIVAKIEELFSELDKGIENLKTARAQLKVYRQAVLKHAFEGKLTAKWREENKDKLETPEQLLARIQQEREARYQQQLEEWKAAVEAWEKNGREGKKPGKPKALLPMTKISNNLAKDLPILPAGWLWVRFGHLSDISGGLTKNQKRNTLSRQMKYLRVANVYADKIILDEVYEIGVTDEEIRKVALEPGDLLIIEGNGSIDQIGRVAVWNGEIPECGHQNHLIRARFLTKSDPRFFLWFMLSPLGRDLIIKKANSTSGLHTLSISKVSNLIVPVLTLKEEAVVLSEIEAKLSIVDKLMEEINAQLIYAASLRQSILKKAFSGQLVPQDPNDEPASQLLERIRAEKVAQAAKQNPVKRAGKKRVTV
jgi:type I restriction enzyme S subunit